MALDMQCRKVQRFNRPLKHCQVASAVSIPKYCELCVMGDYHTPGGGTMEIIPPEGHNILPEGCIIPHNASRGRNNVARGRYNFQLARGQWCYNDIIVYKG